MVHARLFNGDVMSSERLSDCRGLQSIDYGSLNVDLRSTITRALRCCSMGATRTVLSLGGPFWRLAPNPFQANVLQES